jgi:hypothetical protein
MTGAHSVKARRRRRSRPRQARSAGAREGTEDARVRASTVRPVIAPRCAPDVNGSLWWNRPAWLRWWLAYPTSRKSAICGSWYARASSVTFGCAPCPEEKQLPRARGQQSPPLVGLGRRKRCRLHGTGRRRCRNERLRIHRVSMPGAASAPCCERNRIPNLRNHRATPPVQLRGVTTGIAVL